jgi:hypothetical protein
VTQRRKVERSGPGSAVSADPGFFPRRTRALIITHLPAETKPPKTAGRRDGARAGKRKREKNGKNQRAKKIYEILEKSA